MRFFITIPEALTTTINNHINTKWILPIIVISQFFCTSLWFAGNAIMPDIIKSFHLDNGFLAHQTSAVQFGFISGTLTFALLTLADRFSPSLVFFFSSIIAALFNLAICMESIQSMGLIILRFSTGFFLAGIYPVGMKIASDYYQKGLGKSLGFLIGALVLGTAFPHLLKSISGELPWKFVIYSTSVLSVLGGLAVFLFVPNGPFRKQSPQFNICGFLIGFHNSKFRAAAFGYFGHMWELYAFWAYVPVMLTIYQKHHPEIYLNIPLLSFLIIGSGGIACIIGGYISQIVGVKKVASICLLLSCLCCLLSPIFLSSDYTIMMIVFLIFWGLVVVADSPMFSTLVAQNAPEELKGTSLTIVNCIGFSITIISIQFINLISKTMNTQYVYMILSIGPILGLIALLSKNNHG